MPRRESGATLRSTSGRLPMRQSDAPRAANASAIARPMPLLAPVISAVRPTRPWAGAAPAFRSTPIIMGSSFLRQQTLPLQVEGRGRDHRERQTGALGNIEQAVRAVGKIEYPEQADLALAPSGRPADAAVETALAELGLAL